MLKNKLSIIPILDKNGNLLNYLRLSEYEKIKFSEKKIFKKLSIVIMAGGLGKRLDPFTKILPKPLIPIKDKPVIEHILNSFVNLGIKDFIITLNYKSNIIKAYFEEYKFRKNIKFYTEKKPLGTIGSLKKINKQIKDTTILCNCDILTYFDYRELLKFHMKNKFDITLVASKNNIQIQYGTCELDQNEDFFRINEKPKLNYLANIGVYVLEKKALNIIPYNKKYDFDVFLKKAKSLNFKIGVFFINENQWFDIGQWGNYVKTLKDL